MAWRNTASDYGLLTKLIHWVMFLLVVGMFVSANVMTDLPKGPEKMSLYGMHKSFGVLVMMLFWGRLIWRLYSTPPKPQGKTAWQVSAAHAMHVFLYVLMFAMPLSGFVMTVAGGHPVSFFGLFAMPSFIPEGKALAGMARDAHGVIAYTIVLALVGHIGAALWHQFIVKDGALKRMALVGGSNGSRSQALQELEGEG